jgi:hypothetical protein
MDLEGRKNNVYFDQTGKQILVGDLLKVYHFGKGNRTHYMYHVAVMEETKDFPVMAARDYTATKPHYRLYVLCDNEQRVYKTAKIVHTKDWETKRQRIKPINL